MDTTLRWKQRFSNFEKAYNTLTRNINSDLKTEIEKAGLIQFFEITFELSWKVMKDYLEHQGYEIKGPRDAIKISFQNGIINDGHIWLEALEERNMTVHTYDEKFAEKMIVNIKSIYYPEIELLYNKLKEE